ncbi:aminotransferase class IV [Glycomyces buryatensis]|uniref:Aminotransferase IV n=1 Tax=Glycomyces buryatensis TaxID=2570927 RepID=A0A4S8Q8E1_9ACTN|nr:aminotransferase class IV [Glycomyces buryatensis]THV40653.1 aminotransferase IV [Glycomyces buryatensis]
MALVTAVLHRGVVDSDEPILCADDLGVLRGDGVFETINVRDGQAFLLSEHLDRMANSARRMEFELPAKTEMAELAEQALAAWRGRFTGEEAALRLVATRGREHGGPLTVFATIDPVPAERIAPRRDGLNIVTASLGVDADARGKAPWLLGGVKALSYASMMAVTRWAKSQGADDALWVSADGYALEGPTSSLLWLDGRTLCTTPASTGILPGTTSAYLLEHAAKAGLETAERLITVEDLMGTEAAWLSSSVRGVAFITSIDGKAIAQRPDITAELDKLAGFAVPE